MKEATMLFKEAMKKLIAKNAPIAAELRNKRETAGLSMAKAAELTGTPYRTWQDWEGGKRRVPGLAFAWLELYQKQHHSPSL